MRKAPIPENEAQRITALRSLGLLDTLPEERFERITRIAQRLFDVPIASLTLIDANRQWFKSCIGMPGQESPRDIAFCAHAILSDDVLVIPDALDDPRFSDNPLVTGEPHIRFYAGMPLSGPGGFKVGTLCIIDSRPRHFSAADRHTLKDLAAWAENEVNTVELNSALALLRESQAEISRQYREAERARGETLAVFDAASEALILVSSDRRFLSVNRQFTEFFGLTQQQVVGRRFEELQPEVQRAFADPAAFSALVTGTAGDTDRRFTEVVSQQWPVPRELELFSTPVRSGTGEFLGRLYALRDVTHEREVDRMKSEFVSLVSHELRTPLTSIKGYIDLLMDGDAGALNEEQQDYLAIVQNNADRLVALINDLLDVSRIESGRIELRREPLDLVRSIAGVAALLRPQIEAKGQRLTLDLAKDLPAVSGDADRVTQILTNLLSNAYKYTPRGGSITIEAHRSEGNYVLVAVRDTGIGLAPEEQAQLFTKFYRARNALTQEVGGTGLGLTITRSLIEMHGGTIDVTSAPGSGSTFAFTLPTTERPVEQKELLPTARTSGCVLVVEDDPDIAHLIQRYLEHAGYQALIAATAAEALRLARSARPDLITLDVLLPDADGFTVLEWLKSDAVTREIPVVLLSMMDDTRRGKLMGAVDYLRKPIAESVLVERVQAVLAESRRERAHVILVADDDEDMRHLIAGNLRRVGYQVVEATDGGEAVALAQSESPSVALIDIKMPRMDGIAALRDLRSHAATHELPVIMMTASPGVFEESRPVVEALGGSILFSKPHTAEELAGLIATTLQRVV